MSKPYNFESPIVTLNGLKKVHDILETNYPNNDDLESAIAGLNLKDYVKRSDSEITQITTNKNNITEIQGQIVEILENGTGGSASLTIRVTCDSKYEGKTFTATNKEDEQEYTAVVENGVANIIIPDGGNYTVKNNLDALTVEVEVENPLITLAEFFEYTATIRVTLPTALLGSTITCKQGSTVYKIVAISTNVTFNVHKTGEWTVGVDGNSYLTNTVEVVDGNKNYTTEIKIDSETGIPKIEVTTDSKVDGKVIKCKKDNVTLEQTATNKACTFLVPSLGIWTLTCDDFPEKEVTVNVEEAKTYKTRFSMGGVLTLKFDKNNTDPKERVAYEDDAEGMNPATVEGGVVNLNDFEDAFFLEKIYPVMLRADGTVEYKLDPNDYSKKLGGGDSQINQPSQSSNAMVCVEKMYTKFWHDDYYEYMSITDSPKDGYTAFGFLDENGNEMDCFYLAMYLGSWDSSSHLRSLSGQKVKVPSDVYATTHSIRPGVTAQGANYGFGTWSQYQVLDLLFNLIFKTDDCTVLGQGRKGAGEVSGSTGGTLPNLQTGILNDKGPIAVDTASGCVKFMHIEDYFSNRATPLAEMIDGTAVSCSGNNNGKLYIKDRRPYGTLSDNGNVTTNNYKSEAGFMTTTGNIKNSVLSNDYGRVPATGGGTSSTFECDAMTYDQYSISGTKIGCRRGGIHGLASSWFGIHGNVVPYFRGSCVARLSYEPPTAA